MFNTIVYLPASLDVEHLVKVIPPQEIDGFQIEKLKFIISQVLEITANNKALKTPQGFIPVNAVILRSKIRNCNQYLSYLVRADVFECDNSYVPTKKSRGYRLTYLYGESPLLKSEIIDSYRLFKLRIRQRRHHQSSRKHLHLINWFETEGLTINLEAAQEFLLSEYNRKKDDPELWDAYMDKGERKLKDPATQYRSSFINISRLANKEYYPFVDDNVFRLHSNITNLKKDLRNFLSYNGEELVSLDLKNSQPYNSILLFSKDFWAEKMPKSNFHYKTFIKDSKYQPSSIMLSKIAEIIDKPDVELYIKLVTAGEFYEYFGEILKNKCGVSFTRDELKVQVFTIFFTGNGFIGQNDALYKRIFQGEFPNVYKVFAAVKSKKKQLLAEVLQRIESELILARITKRISRERPEVPLFTIHDSIVTTVSNEAYVYEVMHKECELLIGQPPTIKPERWSLIEMEKKAG